MQKNTGIRRIILAAGYSFLGFKAALQHEAAFRQELLLSFVLIPLAFWLDVEPLQRVLMVAVLFLVMIVELLNSAIEAVVDRIGLENHELSGRAKDLGSAAVLSSLLLVAYVWGEVLWTLWIK
ncbi:MAG: diacylglycerol kinase [Deltaproteobacteria bacterium]|jgi:diacylglycerol kinase (ATP)|nr:diacylglycerol kinase [Deltaproteobacteria bacterium]MCW8893871.1 diacylglycerol kinase [Deltaproteobacteria bacterium]MCW9050229.1 diacylglycerol kinase [Deltaproteobacteria bacterium]